MQIASVPPPIITTPLAQEVVAKVVMNIQAVAPLGQRAVEPSPKTERSNKSRSNKDKSKNDSPAKDSESGGRGGSVNIRV